MTDRAYAVADVFCDAPLQGNPVAVFTAADGLDGATMQRVARELNLSETVFVLAPDGEEVDARVRIFTPMVELPFAGHPVLGTAFVLGEDRGLDTVRLRTGAGVVPIALFAVGAAGWLPPVWAQALACAVLVLRIAAIGLVYRHLRGPISWSRALTSGAVIAVVATASVLIKVTLVH